MTVTCQYCNRPAKLVDGSAVYPHRHDLKAKKFWNCTPCKAFVGCHEAGKYVVMHGKKIYSDGTMPLGVLANAELRQAKKMAHASFDPVWKEGGMTRKQAYAWLSAQLGIEPDDCHMGMMSVETCNRVVDLCVRYQRESQACA